MDIDEIITNSAMIILGFLVLAAYLLNGTTKVMIEIISIYGIFVFGLKMYISRKDKRKMLGNLAMIGMNLIIFIIYFLIS